MKRYGNLFYKMCSLENLELAYKNSRKNKTDLPLVKMVDENPLKYLVNIQSMLINKTYKTSKYRIFRLRERGKDREVTDLPYYPDRIIHWGLMLQIEPIFRKLFINETYAALPNKGAHKSLLKLRTFLKDKEGTKYCLKLDIRKFFNNINKTVLKTMLARYIKDKDIFWLLDEIIDSFDNGIPIGNYTSQYFGNFYLTEFDHWLKEIVGIKYYLRYMDDMIILHSSKVYLRNLKLEIDKYLNNNLKVELKKNWQVFPTRVRGIDFVGYKTFEGYTLLRKGTKKRLKAKCRDMVKRLDYTKGLTQKDKGCIASYNGILKWCNSYRLREKSLAAVKKAVIHKEGEKI